MMHPPTWLLLVLPLAPVLSPAAPAAPQAEMSPIELDELLAERTAHAAGLDLEALWREAGELAYLVGDEVGAPFDAAVDRGLGQGERHGPRGTLLLAATRLFGEEIEWRIWTDALLPLLDGEADVALGAAQLLASPELQTRGGSDVRAAAAESLCAKADDGSLGPELRVQCALAGHRVGLGEHKSRAQRVLYGFLRSADPTLRGEGALAMANLGLVAEVPEVEAELERMAAVPGARGRLAAAYIKEQETRRHMERQLRRERERHSDLLDQEGGASSDLRRIDRTIDVVRQYHLEGDKVTREELVEAAIDGMLRSLDPHSAYFSPEVYEKFEQDIEAEYGGIGAYVGVDRDDNLFTITRPIYSGPAYEADLRTDDKIVRIGDWPTIGEEVDDIIDRLKGRPGTDVKLYVWREGMDPTLIERPTEDMAITITRRKISIPPAHSDWLPGDIGLIELNTFNRVASIELIQRIQEFQERGMKGLILDLRNNTGGLLSEAVNVADIFLPAGKRVVSTENRLERSQVFQTRSPALVPEDLPVVVLVNRFSASAAEIVSGALQDHGRAVLVGERTFGKGSVQNLLPMPGERDDEYADENRNGRHDNWETITRDWDGDGQFDFAPRIKLTIERYLLPTGRSIHRELDDEGNIVSAGGVEPDRTVRARRWDQWRLEEMLRVQRTRAIRDWARSTYPGNEQLFATLAAGDRDDPSAYPGFAELYSSLDTILPEDDVRYLMRQEVRRLVQDARGEAFPLGDYQDDLQLQEAIRTLLEEGGRQGIEDIVDYARTFEPRDLEQRSSAPPAALAQRSTDLDQALALIAEAEDGQLSGDSLRELGELLRGMKDRN